MVYSAIKFLVHISQYTHMYIRNFYAVVRVIAPPLLSARLHFFPWRSSELMAMGGTGSQRDVQPIDFEV